MSLQSNYEVKFGVVCDGIAAEAQVFETVKAKSAMVHCVLVGDVSRECVMQRLCTVTEEVLH